jgi:DNA polymerase-3 subunit gamma/tau
MENFVVSARKYRPLGFDEVVGQEHITTTLKNAIDNHKLAQAMLFCGPRGVGKTTCARIVARMINGFEEKAEINSLNIFELDAASNNSVEDIRNLIDQVRYPPQFGKFKVYIIDEVHMLSNAAFNAFLKTLEEPPSYAIFILATTEKHKVIPTILSRCQIFDFNRIQVSDIARQLKKVADREGIQAEEEALHLIAQKADGALRDGLSIFDLMVTFSSANKVTFTDVINNLHILDYEYYFNVVDGLLEENATQPLLLLDEVLRKGFDGHNFISGLSDHFRNLLVSQDARTVTLMDVPDNIRKKYASQAQAVPASLLLSWLSIASQCDINYKGSRNQRLLVELALMKMAKVNSVFSEGATPSPEKMSADPAGLKKKVI